MYSKNKVPIIILLIVIVGIALTLNPRELFSNDSNQIEIDDHSFTNVEVLTTNASVEVTPTSDSIATVAYSGKSKKKSKFIFTAEVKGDTLFVKFKEKRRSFINFNFDFSPSKLELIVNVPDKQYDLIQVESNNGKIEAKNIRSKEVVLETDNGNIEMKNSNTSAVKVKTDNGRIHFEDVDGKIEGITDNGRISLLTNDLNRPIELTTDNGRIEIQTEKEPSNATIDVKTGNGAVEVFGKNNEHQVFGKGKHLIKLRSDNGKITVTK